MEPLSIIIISILIFITSFTGASVGGGGLIVIPVMIALGVPAPAAIASKRVSLVPSSSVSIYKFHKSGKVKWKIGFPLIIPALLATSIATYLVLTIDEGIIKRVISIVIISILIIIILNKKYGLEERARKMRKRHKAAGPVSVFGSVFADHLAGGGGGILLSYSLIFSYGLTFLQSAATRKIFGVSATYLGSAIFIISGIIPWEIAIPMAIASTLGAYFGAHFAIKKGDEFVRNLFIVIVALVSVWLFLF